MKKTKTPIKLFLILLVGMVSINSCRKTENVPIAENFKELEIAQDWYSALSAKRTLATKAISSEPSKKSELKPDWSKAYPVKLASGLSAVIIPVKEFTLGNKDVSLLRMFVFTIKNQEVETGRIVEIYGPKDFLSASTEKLVVNHKNNVIQNFNGSIIFYDISYQYFDGNAYKDGVVSGKAQISTGSGVSSTNARMPSASGGKSAVGNGGGGRMVSTMTSQYETNCWNWYLVEYFSDGTDKWTFMYTKCYGEGGNPPGGTSNSVNTEDPGNKYELLVVRDSIKLIDRFECFNSVPTNTSTTYKVRICADVPVNSNPNALVDLYLAPGHTFIELTKTNGSNTVTEIIGFYPESQVKASGQTNVNSMVVDNQFHPYDASFLVTVNATQFENMIFTAKTKAAKDYNMRGYNCTDYALDVFNSGTSTPLVVPDRLGASTGVNYGTTPNELYNTIKIKKDNNLPGAYIGPGVGADSTDCN